MPEDDFGTQYQHMMSYDALYFNMNPGIHLDGLKIFFKIMFGSELQVGPLIAKFCIRYEIWHHLCLQVPDDMRKNMHVALSHPIYISELFIPHSRTTTPINHQYTEDGLAKLLLFSSFIKAQSQTTIMDYIITEVKKYPYEIRKNSQVRKTLCFDFS